MKNTLKFVIATLILVFTFQLALACNSHDIYDEYNIQDTNDGVIFIGYSTEEYNDYWENENRYPTYDYRHGYTYRVTDEYQDKDYRYYDDERYYPHKRTIFQERPYVYYEYSDYMRSYQEYECYSHPPKDKLIYVKCP